MIVGPRLAMGAGGSSVGPGFPRADDPLPSGARSCPSGRPLSARQLPIRVTLPSAYWLATHSVTRSDEAEVISYHEKNSFQNL